MGTQPSQLWPWRASRSLIEKGSYFPSNELAGEASGCEALLSPSQNVHSQLTGEICLKLVCLWCAIGSPASWALSGQNSAHKGYCSRLVEEVGKFIKV
jgi:hypothetical protein